MIKTFGKLTYLQITIMFFGLASAGTINNGYGDEGFLMLLGGFLVLGLLQFFFTRKTIELLNHQEFHEVSVIDDPLSFENKSLKENKLVIKIIGIILMISYAVLLFGMCVLLDELYWRVKQVFNAESALTERQMVTLILFFGCILTMPLILITIWYNLNMFKTKRIVTDEKE